MKLFTFLLATVLSSVLQAQTSDFMKIENQIKDHINHGRWDEVMLKAPDLLIEEPTRGEGYYYTALAFLNIGQGDKAKEYADKAELMAEGDLVKKIQTLKDDITNLKKANQIQQNAESKEKGGSKKVAADEWVKLWEMDRTKKEYALNAVELYVEGKRYEEAMKILNHASMKNDEGAMELIRRLNKTPEMVAVNGYNDAMQAGKSHFDKGNYQSAIKSFETALSHRSNDADASLFKRKAQDEIAWNDARNTNTLDAYEKYAYGRTLLKYKDRAIGIIQNTLIKWGQEYADKNDISQAEHYLNKYLNDFPGGDDRMKARQILCTLYDRNAKANSKIKTYYGQSTAYDFYGKAKKTCMGTYSYDQDMKKAKKLMTRFGRPDRTYVAYTYDSVTPIGISIGGLKNRNPGIYIGFRMNKDFLTGTTYFTVDNNGNYTGTALSDIRQTGETRNGQAEGVFGLTKKIAYPFWIYAGGGVAFRQQLMQVDSYYSNGSFNETAWVKNTDEKSFKPLAEAGLIVDLSGFHLRGGVKSSDFETLNYQVGIGFSFK